MSCCDTQVFIFSSIEDSAMLSSMLHPSIRRVPLAIGRLSTASCHSTQPNIAAPFLAGGIRTRADVALSSTGPAMAIPATEMTSFLSVAPVLSITTFFDDLCASLFGPSVVMIKRTYQPSIIRKRRKQGFLERQKTIGGRRVLKRRRQKGRARLGGC